MCSNAAATTVLMYVRRYANCRCGPECGNRRFQQHAKVKTQPFGEAGRGWGLQVIDPVTKGELICEYLGEVIDEKMMQVCL
jgi:[histone H3]-lysine36 N-dimethyltransferase SETMAR